MCLDAPQSTSQDTWNLENAVWNSTYVKRIHLVTYRCNFYSSQLDRLLSHSSPVHIRYRCTTVSQIVIATTTRCPGAAIYP